jgi:DNA-binding transcriptional LysR family regulator
LEIQQLRHLIAAVKHGSFAKAAEESNISQPGLSRSIRALEERVGYPLLERGANGLHPTPFGLSVLRRAQVIINEVARAKEELRALGSAMIGDVTFGVTQNFAHYILPEVLARLHQQHARVRYNVITGGTLELLEMVRNATIDFGFGLIGAVPEGDDLRFEFLVQHRSVIACRPSHSLAAQDTVSASDLADANWVTVASAGFQRSYRNFFLARGLNPPTPAVVTNSLPLIKRMVLHADLLTSIPQEVVREDVGAGKLVLLKCEPLAEFTRIAFFLRADGFMSPQMKQALDAIREAVVGGLASKSP